jgi:hypothetical protein
MYEYYFDSSSLYNLAYNQPVIQLFPHYIFGNYCCKWSFYTYSEPYHSVSMSSCGTKWRISETATGLQVGYIPRYKRESHIAWSTHSKYNLHLFVSHELIILISYQIQQIFKNLHIFPGWLDSELSEMLICIKLQTLVLYQRISIQFCWTALYGYILSIYLEERLPKLYYLIYFLWKLLTIQSAYPYLQCRNCIWKLFADNWD